MNCLALEQRGEVILIDCGVTFDDRGLGIDVVHPDFAALERVTGSRASFVTHGHEDHIGALPYFLRRFDVPGLGAAVRARARARARSPSTRCSSTATCSATKPRGRIEVGLVRGRADPRDALDRRRDRARDQDRRGDSSSTRATSSSTRHPPDGETFDVDAASTSSATRASRCSSATRRTSTPRRPTGSERGRRRARSTRIVGGRASGGRRRDVRVERAPAAGCSARSRARHGRRIVLLGRSVQTHARVARRRPAPPG